MNVELVRPLYRDASPASTSAAFPGLGCRPREMSRKFGSTSTMHKADDHRQSDGLRDATRDPDGFSDGDGEDEAR